MHVPLAEMLGQLDQEAEVLLQREVSREMWILIKERVRVMCPKGRASVLILFFYSCNVLAK